LIDDSKPAGNHLAELTQATCATNPASLIVKLKAKELAWLAPC
jgi:hypothetical protein